MSQPNKTRNGILNIDIIYMILNGPVFNSLNVIVKLLHLEYLTCI